MISRSFSIALVVLSMPAVAVAQSPGPTTAIFDVAKVMSRYEKHVAMKKKFDDELAPIRAEAERIKATLTQIKTEAEDPKNSPEMREQARQSYKVELARLGRLDKETKEDLGKRVEAGHTEVWKEIRAAVAKHAEAAKIDVVIAYGDLAGLDADAYPNLKRKMNAMDIGAGVVFYARPGLDITDAIVTRLNEANPAGPKKAKPATK